MIVAIIAGYAPSLIGFRGPLLQALVLAGHDVYACAAEDDSGVTSTLRNWGIVYRAMPLQRAGLDPLRDWSYHRVLRNWLAKIGAEVVIPYTHKPVVYAALAVQSLPNSPRVYPLITGLGFVFIGSVLKARIAKWVMTMLYRQASKHFSGVFFQNPDDLELFRALRLIRSETRRLVVRGSGIELSEFAHEFPYTSFQLSATKFLLIARLLGDKGIREYVEAARLIRAAHPVIEFHLVGPTDPNPAAISIEEVMVWQREGTIIYHGSQSDVRPILRECTVYVLPSYREGTPRTVLEAMATGRAVITTDAPGCRETVFNAAIADNNGVRIGENGMLVPVKSIDALVAAMMRFIKEPCLAETMGLAGRRLAEEHYDVHKVNQQMLEFMGLVPRVSD